MATGNLGSATLPHPQYLIPAEMDARLLAGHGKRFFHTSF